MFKRLNEIQTPKDLKALPVSDLTILAHDIRKFLIQSIARTGGHLASNLGIVELTLALHYVFNSPQDQFVWDVGHQAYVHKIVTGRRRDFKELRKLGGMSGFPKCHESEHDLFETGHSSTSISAALGMAVARDLEEKDHQVVAVIGDGALTGGMAFEALNNAGRSNTKIIVILNDNEMSIGQNVGGITQHLSYIRSRKEYIRVKEDVEDILQKVPLVGNQLVHTVKKTKDSVKSLLIENTLFEELGFTYLGPINGHDFNELIDIFENAKTMDGPVIIHIKTKKGKGYHLAEKDPSNYHGVAPFNALEGIKKSPIKKESFSEAFGQALTTIGQKDFKVVAITAAMCEGTGLTPFAETFPKRFFDVGIAEQHAVTFAAGLATQGYKPVVAVYSSFLQRAYDQILHDVALQNLSVIFCIDRAGLVGEDGATHQGIFDIAYLSHIPNMTLISVKMPSEMENALRYARTLKGPVGIRYPRGTTTLPERYKNPYQSVQLREIEPGTEAVLITTGKSVEWGIQIRELCKMSGMDLGLVEMPCVFPLDKDGLDQLQRAYTHIFTLEDHVLEGGMGQKVSSYLSNTETTVENFGYPFGIIEHGDIPGILEREGLAPHQVANHILNIFKKERT